ncbi:MAG: DinB family protein [Bacteroidota bacterium]
MNISDVALSVLNDLRDAITQIEDEHYRKGCDTLSGSTIGQHVRHTVEFFLCLQQGLEHGEVNYDLRKRDIQIELDKVAAIDSINGIKTVIVNQSSNKELELHAEYGDKESATVSIPSNYYRELSYNIEHAIHHMALIKIGIRESCGYVDLPEGFGVASSTLRYQKQ